MGAFGGDDDDGYEVDGREQANERAQNGNGEVEIGRVVFCPLSENSLRVKTLCVCVRVLGRHYFAKADQYYCKSAKNYTAKTDPNE